MSSGVFMVDVSGVRSDRSVTQRLVRSPLFFLAALLVMLAIGFTLARASVPFCSGQFCSADSLRALFLGLAALLGIGFIFELWLKRRFDENRTRSMRIGGRSLRDVVRLASRLQSGAHRRRAWTIANAIVATSLGCSALWFWTLDRTIAGGAAAAAILFAINFARIAFHGTTYLRYCAGTLLNVLVGVIPLAILFLLPEIIGAFVPQILKEARFLIGAVAALPFALFAASSYPKISQMMRPTWDEVRHADQRPPITWIRSFTDDLLPALDHKGRPQSDGERVVSFEEAFAKYARDYGPFITIGAPGELSCKGAARDYFAGDTEWREAIQALFAESLCIVAVLGFSEGLRWEFAAITRAGHLSKTLFFFPPNCPRHQQRCQQFREVLLGTRFKDAAAAADLSHACGALLSPTGEVVVINARPAGIGSYEAGLAIALAGFGPTQSSAR